MGQGGPTRAERGARGQSPRVEMAGSTRLELATSGVTGRRSNQLNYDPAQGLWVARQRRLVAATASEGWWAVQDLNL